MLITPIVEALELTNLVSIAYQTAVSASNRTESRGAHSKRIIQKETIKIGINIASHLMMADIVVEK